MMQDGMAFADFLTNIPPNRWEPIKDIIRHNLDESNPAPSQLIRTPNLELYCRSCKGDRIFRYKALIVVPDIVLTVAKFHELGVNVSGKITYHHIRYQCSNCQESDKIYSLAVKITIPVPIVYTGNCCKLGETPSFGPHVPETLTALMPSDQMLLLEKGMKSESAGYGIGAYTYYRRIVESQVDTLLSKTVDVLQVNRPPNFEEQIDILHKAIEQKMVGAKLNTAKDSRPQFLFYNGKDLLSVLNERLGRAIHNYSDEECLNLARHIRRVLAEICVRISEYSKRSAELDESVFALNPKDDESE